MSKINYDLTKIRGVAFDVDGVLSPAVVPLDSTGNPMRMANIKDGYALRLAAKEGLNIAIISGAQGEGLVRRFNYLGITDVYLKAGSKIDVLKKWMAYNNLKPEEVAFAGDDVPDSECMRYVGLSVAPSDSCSDILMMATYVSPCKGGYGVGRDLLEEILRATGKWPQCDTAFG